MTLILRKCAFDGYSSNNFFYGNTGERVTCPDWDSHPICGNGLHGLRDGNGNWNLLEGTDWLIIDADDQVVDIDNQKCKFNTGVIEFRGTEEELAKTDFSIKLDLNERSAYFWAREIGNADYLMNKINDSSIAFSWAVNIGNQDVMINKIDNSRDALFWAYRIGNQDVMKPKIIDQYHTNLWNSIFTSNKIESN